MPRAVDEPDDAGLGGTGEGGIGDAELSDDDDDSERNSKRKIRMSPPTFKNYETFHASRDVVCDFYSDWFDDTRSWLEADTPPLAIVAMEKESRRRLSYFHPSEDVDWGWVARRLVEQTEWQMQRRAA